MRNLKLEVILSAIDKATRPIKTVMGSSQGLSRQLRDTKDKLRDLNAAQQKLDAFTHLKKSQQDAAGAIQKAQDRTRELALRLNEARQAAKPLQETFDAAQTRTDQLRDRQKALTQQMRDQQGELGRANAAWEKQRAKIAALNAQLAKNPTDQLRAEYKQLTAVQVDNLAKVRALEASLKQLKGQKREAGRELFKYRGELQHLKSAAKEASANVGRLGADFNAARDSARRLKDQHSRQSRELEGLRRGLQAAGISTKDMASAQTTLREHVRRSTESIDRQNDRLTKLAERQNRQRAARGQYEQHLENRDRVAGAGAAAAGAGSAVGLPIVKMVRDYSRYEDAMLGVARQVEGARDANGKLTATYYQMGDAIKAMSETIPMATTQIAALIEGGARMGIQGKDNLLAFARTAALASTAFDLPADQISEDLGKIANTYKIPIKNIEQLGDVINYMDDNAQSKGADIINVMQRIAGSTGSMNFKEAAALGSTFLSLGASAEVAATATKAMVRELAIAEKQPKRFQAGLKELGLNAKQIQAEMAKDSTGTIFKVLEAVKKLPEAKRMGVMVDLFSKEYGDDAAKLADNLGEYRKQLALVNEAKARGSMAREGDAKNDTLSAQWQMLQNKLFNQSSGLGSTLRQPLIDIMQAAGRVTDKITAWTKANPELTATLVKIAAVVAVVLAALGSLMLAFAGFAGPIIATRFLVKSLGIQFGSLLPEAAGLRKAMDSMAPALGRVSAGAGQAAVAVRAKLAKAWRDADPSATKTSMLDFAKSLRERIPMAAARARLSLALLWAATKQWTMGLGGAIKARIISATLTMRGYTAQLWQAVLAQRAAMASRWTGFKQYAGAAGAKGMAGDAAKGGWRFIKGGATAAIGGAASALSGLARAFLFVSRLAMANPIGLALTAAAFLVIKYWEPIKAWFTGFWKGLTDGLRPLSGIFGATFASLGTALAPLKPVWDWLTAALGSAWSWLTQLFTPINATKQSLDAASASGKNFGQFLANIIVVAGTLVAKFLELPAKFVGIGMQIMQGLVSGITNGLASVKSAITGAGASTIAWFKEKLGIHSPSRVFAELGGFTMAGLAQGLEGGQGGPLGAVMSVAKKLTAAGAGIALASATGMAAAVPIDNRPPVSVPRSAPAATAPITITVQAAPGMNEQLLAQLVAREVERLQRQTAARGRGRLTDRD
ncbi:phage tail tape measure protein [Crenobacter luteus]|uniref:phage tail tape measure protein n=1 Tax=Crenobacter luteus TaxID=1452487 RepID=UPI001FB78E14|nr:phage tail tape measure protein [Crenobacter luteus]